MKKIKAFGAALMLFFFTAAGLHILISGNLDLNNKAYNYWTDGQKFSSAEGLRANMEKNSFLVFGSSEFQHGTNSKYYIKNLLGSRDVEPVLIGAGYYQSLYHAMTLAAVEPGVKNRRVMLFISPPWFKKKGVEGKAFAARFSEDIYLSCMENPKLSKQSKDYINRRTKELLKDDPSTLQRIKGYEKLRYGRKIDSSEKLLLKGYTAFLKEKGRFATLAGAAVRGIWRRHSKELPRQLEAIDWERYRQAAQKDGQRLAKGNAYNMMDKTYRQEIAPKEKRKKNSDQDHSYLNSREYDDLQCFLKVCQEFGMEVQLVSLPVNGAWYDYTGFPRADREQYYENIRKIAQRYQVGLVDLSNHEYTKYFFEDSVHFALKGWVYLSETVYNFAKEDKK